MISETILPGASKSENEHRRDICVAGRWLRERGFIAATDGNVSVRLDAQRVLTSPTGLNKGMLGPDDLVIVDLEGHKLSGTRSASSEIAMHLLIYRRRPDVNAVCHAHPPVATGYAAAGVPLDKALLGEMVLCLVTIPLAPYGTPGTTELSEAMAPLVAFHDAILMANHGVVTCGPDLLTATHRMETTEHFARVSLVTELLGKQHLLSSADVEKLLAARPRYGLPPASPDQPRPVTAEASASGDNRITITREELAALIEDALRNDRTCR